jgi:hypothetical protein
MREGHTGFSPVCPSSLRFTVHGSPFTVHRSPFTMPFTAHFFSNSLRYSPYPSAASLLTGMKRKDAEFMQ